MSADPDHKDSVLGGPRLFQDGIDSTDLSIRDEQDTSATLTGQTKRRDQGNSHLGATHVGIQGADPALSGDLRGLGERPEGACAVIDPITKFG